jgi:hypothetical protein
MPATNLFGTSEHDFWFELWRTIDREGVRLLELRSNLPPNAALSGCDTKD